jgi:hypothetical protein
MVIGVLAAVDVGLWILRGEETLYRDAPAMARVGLQYLRRPGGPCHQKASDIVVLNDEHGPPEPSVMRELQATYALYGCTLYSELSFPRAPLTNTECPGCLAFSYRVRWNTPLIAEVYTHQFLYAYSSMFRHRRVWFFGIWLPIGDDFAGQE